MRISDWSSDVCSSDLLDLGGVTLADALMAPTALYVKPVLELLRGEHGASIHAMAHITGGGLTENIIRVVPDGLGLDIEASTLVLPPVFEWLQREGAVEIGRGSVRERVGQSV